MITTTKGTEFQIQMLDDAIHYHQFGDDEDAPCCTAEAPCETRIWVLNRRAELGGSDLVPVVETPEQTRTQTGGTKASTGARVANPASEKQIAFINRLVGERDATALTTYPARTLRQIQAGDEVSMTRAKSLIDNLLRAPRTEVQTATPAGPAASEAQIGFLRTLTAEHGEEIRTSYTKAEASAEITRLIGLREAAKKSGQVRTQGQTAEPGMYKKDGKIYKVQIAVHGSGRPYAKVLTEVGGEWSFERAPGMVHRLTAKDRMTLKEAKEWGTLYGACCVCATTLTDETSIAEGIGPVCGGRV